MILQAENKEIKELRATNILPQTPFWAKVKNDQGFIPSGFQLSVSKDLIDPNENGNIKTYDDLLILIKPVNDSQCFAYVPYGPKLEPEFENHGVFLEELSEVLRPHLPANCVFIRYDLLWENQWARDDDYYDDEGNWLGPPPVQTQEFRLNFNTNNWNLRKSPGDILPKNTFFLNLNLNEKELLGKMRYNTRYNIKKAFRGGVRVREYGIENLDDWYKLYCETSIRHNMVMQDKDYFASLLINQEQQDDDVKVNLLMADLDGEILASMFLVLSNKRGIYLFGASSSDNKQHMASYALQWESIKRAKKYGCSEYDLFGCAPNLDTSHPLHGVHLYKKGFGGELFHRMGCWDYPFIQDYYDLLITQEMNN